MGQRITPVIENMALALGINDDGRSRGVGTRHLLQMGQVDAFRSELLTHHAPGIVGADCADKTHPRAEPRTRYRGIGRHATTHDLIAVRWRLGCTLGKPLDLEHMVDSAVTHTSDQRSAIGQVDRQVHWVRFQ